MVKADIEPLRRVYLETRSNAFAWVNATDLQDTDFDRDTEGEKIWVAEELGQIVGFISVWEPENYIHHLFVLPKFANQGHGSSLLSICMKNIGRPAKLKCVSRNKNALEFYRRKGWETISTDIDSNGEYQLMQVNET